jgi:hypothetical protein
MKKNVRFSHIQAQSLVQMKCKIIAKYVYRDCGLVV